MRERIYHLGLQSADSARYAILPGDPGRVESIAALLSNPKKIAENREFITYAGFLGSEQVLVTSTGIGGPSAAIAMEELAMLGIKNFLRVGTCGGMQQAVLGGDIIIPTGCIRFEGTSKEYLPLEFPAVPDFKLLCAVENAAAREGCRYHTGVVQSKDSFYAQHEPERMPIGPELMFKWNAFIKAGALASEMECAALFSVAACLHVSAAAVLLCVWNQERARAGLENCEIFDTSVAVRIAVEAIKGLINNKK